jgi:hypothetical protein
MNAIKAMKDQGGDSRRNKEMKDEKMFQELLDKYFSEVSDAELRLMEEQLKFQTKL